MFMYRDLFSSGSTFYSNYYINTGAYKFVQYYASLLLSCLSIFRPRPSFYPEMAVAGTSWRQAECCDLTHLILFPYIGLCVVRFCIPPIWPLPTCFIGAEVDIMNFLDQKPCHWGHCSSYSVFYRLRLIYSPIDSPEGTQPQSIHHRIGRTVASSTQFLMKKIQKNNFRSYVTRLNNSDSWDEKSN